MGHRVLGITCNERTVRFAVVETRLRRFELKAAHEVSRTSGAGGDEPPWAAAAAAEVPSGATASYETAPVPPLSIVEAVNRALLPPLSSLDSVAMAFPGDRAFVRRVTFPFKEADKIEAALPMQMVGQVLQPDDIHCAFERVTSGPAGTEVLAVAVRREDFSEWLSERRAAGVDPSHVSVDGVCMLALVPYLPEPEDGGSRMIVWAEDATLDVVVADGPRPVVARSTMVGEPVLSGNEPSAAFLREVVLSAAAASEAGARVAAVHVAGPGAEHLVGPLFEALSVPCLVLDPSRLALPGVETCVGLSPSMTKAVALAIGAASGGGAGTLDLRTGAYSVEGGQGLLRERFRYFASVLVLFALLGVGGAVAKYVGLSAEREAVVADLRAFTAQVLGKERDDFDAVLKQVKSLTEEDVRIFPRWTAVDTLNRVVGAVMGMGKRTGTAGGDGGDKGGEAGVGGIGPGGAATTDGAAGATADPTAGAESEGYKVELESVRVEPRGVAIRGEADSIETLDGLVARLKTDPCFRDVVTESTERIQFERHQGWQRFAVRLTVDCSPKEAPGKKIKLPGTLAPATTAKAEVAR